MLPVATIEKLKRQLRDLSFQPHEVKMASLGGGVDTPFEQAFSNLAHIYIKDKAPKLLDYEIGFQLVSKNQGDTKAVGIFGFKVGNQWIYAPVFFLNGDLKGHELLYLKAQDMFVPMADDWVDYLLGKKPTVLGEGINRNLSLMGIMPPNLYQLSRSPQKFASAGCVFCGFNTNEHLASKLDKKVTDWQKYASWDELMEVLEDDVESSYLKGILKKSANSWDLTCPKCFKITKLAYSGTADDRLTEKDSVDLSPGSEAREEEPKSDFARPGGKVKGTSKKESGKGSYPIPDKSHARAAVGFCEMHHPGQCGDIKAKVHNKFGVDMSTWALDFMPTLGYLVTTPINKIAKYTDIKTFPDFLKDTGEPSFRFVVEKIGSTYPTILRDIDNIYGPELLTNIAKQIVSEKKAESNSILKDACTSTAGDPLPKGWNGKMQKPSKVNGGIRSDGEEAWEKSQEGRRKSKAWVGNLNTGAKVYGGHKSASIIPSLIGPIEALPEGIKHKVINRVMVDEDPDIIHSLKEDERATLLKERVVFKDTRDKKDVTIAYNVQTPLKLRNPDRTGIFYVLTEPDTFEKCLIIYHPYATKYQEDGCLVVRLDGKKNFVCTHQANIWIKGELDNDSWKKWLKDQKDLESIPVYHQPKKDEYKHISKNYIIITSSGDGTIPFYAKQEFVGENDKSKSYDVSFSYHHTGRRPAWLPEHKSNESWESCDDYGSHRNPKRIVLSNTPGTKIRIHEGELSIPAESKIIEVFNPGYEDRKYDRPVRLGNLIDVQTAIMSHTTPMKVVSDGKDVTVNENRMDKTSALCHLFRDHGLSKEASEEIINKATLSGKCEVRLVYPDYIKACWAKQATDPGNDMIRGAPNAPPFPEPYMGYDPMTGSNIPTMQPSEFNTRIQDMSASKTDRSTYYPFGPDPKSMQVAQQASRTGQKEVFDTAMLGSMLKTVRTDNMIDKYFPDMMKGMDRLGRILFLSYWHGEEFEDRYGKQDMPEIEDGLRNTFESIGDLILRLKRKTIDPYMDDSGKIDLGPVSNAD